MKHFILAAFLAASTSALAGGTTKTDTFAVNGDCGMCEVTIEKAAKLPGVSSADWDADAKTLIVRYSPKKVTPDDILRSIAKEGYDTEKFTATDASYKALPQCCQYDRKAIAAPKAR
jgi:copper chaperone CopZ